MKAPWKMVAGVLMTAAFSLPATAQTAQDRELARKICEDQSGSAFNLCVQQQLRNFNCASAISRQQCEARKQASQQCVGLFGWEFRQCTQAMLQPDCSTLSPIDRQSCELNQQAIAKCSSKQRAEHMDCLREHFSGQ